ncbi:MAG: CHASE sensor domain-containing protein [Bryobacteraceae bacterium]
MPESRRAETAWYGRLSIKYKLLGITMAVVFAALLLSCAAFAGYDVLVFRHSLIRDLQTLAELIGSNSTAAVAFGDKSAAEEMLAGLRAKPHLYLARIYNAEGKLFASYERRGVPHRPNPRLQADGSHFESDRLVLFQGIVLEGRRIGTLYLESDLDEIRERLTRFSGITCLVLMAALVTALGLISKLLGIICTPILHLAQIAKRVSMDQDYSIRAEKQNSDELGELVDGFNEMLGRVQRQRDHLEEEVSIRTSELLVAKENAEAAARRLQEEVTAKELANTQLAEAQQQLMDVSRRAGMAEIATGVLHNVGNVLNSVNVSATVVANKVRDSRVTKLSALTGMLEEHSSGLSDFLANDPQGQRVFPYLTKLSSHLEGERQGMLQELKLLMEHVGHIKQIVATQQSYAKVSGLVEIISPAELVEYAVRIVQPGLEARKIRVERDFDDVPPMALDKHTVLQILLNLLRNAEYAITERDSARNYSAGRILIRIRRSGDELVRVSVTDNGIGIPPENLTKIFSHGFTTRRDGHGFGLHSGANAAQEMGGTLYAESGGPGLGATVTLELPLTTAAADECAGVRRNGGSPQEPEALEEHTSLLGARTANLGYRCETIGIPNIIR